MSLRLEIQDENKVVQWAKENGIKTFKIHFAGHRGATDRLFIVAGYGILWVEFKRAGEKPRALQEYVHRILRSAKQQVAVCDNTADAISLLKAALGAARVSEARLADDADPSMRRPFSGPWFREDGSILSGFQGIEEDRVYQENAGDSATQADLFGLAGRDKKVE